MDITLNIPTLSLKHWSEFRYCRKDGYKRLVPSIEMVTNQRFFKVFLEHKQQGDYYQPVRYDANYVRYYYGKETIVVNGKTTVKCEDDELIEIIKTESQKVENWLDIIRELRRRENLTREEFWSESGFVRQQMHNLKQYTLQGESLGLKAMAPIVIYSHKKGHVDLVRVVSKLWRNAGGNREQRLPCGPAVSGET
ncbi:hypothetical protein M595_5120 [Lyngbya aestuarii BL J]|uniref:Uncharacterized protein n=1 Tax=Lyngbya aestuarii BL J TaxID=1348334 RepID=U7QES5_9CYAN|nr:hypothetical protein [Lyngbya aestuarii]ERT04936.1 hypothetical protein M595_5120 [Lyngbya aestuarii BL J]